MVLGTSAPSQMPVTTPAQFPQIVENISESVLRPETAAEFRISLADPLPSPNLNVARKYPGARSLYSFAESAHQNLPPRPVVVRKRRIDLSDAIEKSACLEGIDPLLVEIVIEHESAFNPEAASGVGARGLMQLMPETARDLGVTDIHDPEQNIAAGTRYLAQQYRHYANLHLALAAYNAGPGNVDYYKGVPPFDETRRYAASIASEYEARRSLLP